jgi:hypothetical protein
VKKLCVAMLVSILASGSANVLADDIDMKPLAGMSAEQAIAARKVARDHWARMTPQERMDAIRAARGKKRDELTAIDQYARQQMALRYDGEQAPAPSRAP